MRKHVAFAAAAIAVAALAGCGRNGGPAYTPAQPYGSAVQAPLPNVAGTYKGSIQDQLLGSGTVTIVFKQSGSTITGTVTPTLHGQSRTFQAKGSVFVKSGMTKVKFTISSSGCTGASTGTVTSTNHLNGAYTVTCNSTQDKGTYKTIKS